MSNIFQYLTIIFRLFFFVLVSYVLWLIKLYNNY
jgi:hypothetical protein